MEHKTKVIIPKDNDIPIVPYILSEAESKDLCLTLALNLPLIECKFAIPIVEDLWTLDHQTTGWLLHNSYGSTLDIYLKEDSEPQVDSYTRVKVLRVSIKAWILAFSNNEALIRTDNLDISKPPQSLVEVLRSKIINISINTYFGNYSKLLSVYKTSPSSKSQYLMGPMIKEAISEQENKITTYYVNGKPRNIKRYVEGLLDGDEVIYSYQGVILEVLPWYKRVKTGIGQRWLFNFSIEGTIISASPMRYYYWFDNEEISRTAYEQYLAQYLYQNTTLDRDITGIIGQYY